MKNTGQILYKKAKKIIPEESTTFKKARNVSSQKLAKLFFKKFRYKNLGFK